MAEEESTGTGGSLARSLILIVAAIIAGVFAIKLTFWAIKWVLVLAVVGLVGYLSYSAVKGLLPSSRKTEVKGVLPDAEDGTKSDGDPLKELDDVLRELDQIKRMRGE